MGKFDGGFEIDICSAEKLLGVYRALDTSSVAR